MHSTQLHRGAEAVKAVVGPLLPPTHASGNTSRLHG